nr:hypothetical protein [Angustibacter aerolatus]
MLPKHLDEKVARLHLDALGVHLTEPRSRRPSTSASTWPARTNRTTTATEHRGGHAVRHAPVRLVRAGASSCRDLAARSGARLVGCPHPGQRGVHRVDAGQALAQPALAGEALDVAPAPFGQHRGQERLGPRAGRRAVRRAATPRGPGSTPIAARAPGCMPLDRPRNPRTASARPSGSRPRSAACAQPIRWGGDCTIGVAPAPPRSRTT